MQKWHPPALLSLNKFPACACLSSSYFKISKWVSCMYSPGDFHSVALMLDLRASGFVCEPDKSEIFVPFSSAILFVLTLVEFQN